MPEPSQRRRLSGPQQGDRHHVDAERQGAGRKDARTSTAGYGSHNWQVNPNDSFESNSVISLLRNI